MSRKKKIPKLIMLYDLSEASVNAIPFHPADYTERRNKKKKTIDKEEKESPIIEDNLVLPAKPPDRNDHATNLLKDKHDAFDEIFKNIFENFAKEMEKGLSQNESQSSEYFLSDDCFFNY